MSSQAASPVSLAAPGLVAPLAECADGVTSSDMSTRTAPATRLVVPPTRSLRTNACRRTALARPGCTSLDAAGAPDTSAPRATHPGLACSAAASSCTATSSSGCAVDKYAGAMAPWPSSASSTLSSSALSSAAACVSTSAAPVMGLSSASRAAAAPVSRARRSHSCACRRSFEHDSSATLASLESSFN
eukprot:351395-Chlamydomonas_euryale.AAC.9